MARRRAEADLTRNVAEELPACADEAETLHEGTVRGRPSLHPPQTGLTPLIGARSVGSPEGRWPVPYAGMAAADALARDLHAS